MLRAELKGAPALNADLGNAPALNVDLGNVTVQIIGGDIYDDSYEVTPNFERQTLPTARKTLTEDIAVLPITIHRTSNQAGGTTVFIGGIIDG